MRIAVAAVVIAAPSALFLGCRPLMVLIRIGELVERIRSEDRVATDRADGGFARPDISKELLPTGGSDSVCSD